VIALESNEKLAIEILIDLLNELFIREPQAGFED
jgi:hypothetical protein